MSLPSKKFVIVCPPSYDNRIRNKVEVIKAIRGLTGLGLKDAKDASERTHDQVFTLNLYPPVTRTYIEEQFQILRESGVRVGTPAFMILDDLQALSVQALENGETELANEITQLIVAERLRREP